MALALLMPEFWVATLGDGGFLLGPPIIGFVTDHAALRSALGIALVSAALVASRGAQAFRLVRSHQQ